MINHPYYYQKFDFNRHTFHYESKGDKCYSLRINCSMTRLTWICMHDTNIWCTTVCTNCAMAPEYNKICFVFYVTSHFFLNIVQENWLWKTPVKKKETTNVQYMKSIYFPKHYKAEFSCMLLVRDTKLKSNANAEELIEGLTVIKKRFACSMSLHQARKHIMTMR